MFEYPSREVKFIEIPQSECEADAEALISTNIRTKQSWMSRLWPPLCLLIGLAIGGYLSSYLDRMRNLDYQCIRHIAEDCKLFPSTVGQ